MRTANFRGMDTLRTTHELQSLLLAGYAWHEATSPGMTDANRPELSVGIVSYARSGALCSRDPISVNDPPS